MSEAALGLERCGLAGTWTQAKREREAANPRHPRLAIAGQCEVVHLCARPDKPRLDLAAPYLLLE